MIMSSKTIRCVLTFMTCIAINAIAAEIHPGLKNAIDAGDVKLAKNIIEKVGVTDIYCPEALSVNDAEKIYATILQDDSLAIIHCKGKCHIEYGFFTKYLEKNCNGKQEKNHQICNRLWEAFKYSGVELNSDSLLSLWIKDNKGICQSKETVENCKDFFDRVKDDSLKMELLRLLDKKKLLKYTIIEEEYSQGCERVRKKSFDKSKCLKEAQRKYRSAVAECNKQQRRVDLCLSGAVDNYNSRERNCEDDFETKCYGKVNKTKKEVEPFYFSSFYEKMFSNWLKMDESWKKDASMLSKYFNEDQVINDMIKQYKENADIDIGKIIGYCKISPKFEKNFNKKIGFDFLSCKNILSNYPLTCDESKDSLRSFGNTINGDYPNTYLCANGSWKDFRINEVCGNSRKGLIIDKYMCDSVWKSVAFSDLAEISCEDGVEIQSKHIQKLSYKCDHGNWIADIEGTQSVVDLRDGAFYRIKQIGDQVWMTENLQYITEKSKCYMDNCAKYGRYYTWPDAMDSAAVFSKNSKDCGYGKECSIALPARGICPEGWHIPTINEWRTLDNTMERSAYNSQATGYTKWPKATDVYNFSAIPAGLYYEGDGFVTHVGSYAGFWSADESGQDKAYLWEVNEDRTDKDYSFKQHLAYSIRCLKDQ